MGLSSEALTEVEWFDGKTGKSEKVDITIKDAMMLEQLRLISVLLRRLKK